MIPILIILGLIVVVVLWLIGIFLGAVPAVTWVGRKLVGGRRGAAAALLVGGLLWRGSMWLFPLAAVLLYLAGVVVGLGSFAVAGWEVRARQEPEWRPLPPESAPQSG